MAVPYHVIAAKVKTVIDTEFAPEGITARHDELHEALGTTGPVVGIAPQYEQPMANDYNVNEIWFQVQFFNTWQKRIDPTQAVDPFIITGYADRLRRAIRVQQATDAGTGEVWYFKVERIEYPRDPTGNKSRFIATLRAFGNNTAIVETTG